MANTTVNKVVLGNETLIDLTGDTVTAASLLQGYTAHDASGAPITGTASGGTEDGHVYQDANGYIVLDDETGKVYQTVSKSYTPTESQQSESITPGTGYDALAQVNVTVGAISSSYVGSGITRRSSSDLTASGATVTVPAGYYATAASKSVASGSVSASATKGTVTNHSVSVTPTASVTAGYISSGATGTAVTVSASELVSGTKSITANGTGIDVSEFAAVDVAVPSVSPTLITKSITANGTYNASSDNADGYSSVTVNVSGGGGVLKMGVIRPDAELVESWTYDKYIVDDENVTIPSYSTSQQTLKSSAVITTTPTLDYDTYDYIALVRAIATPKYATGTTQGSGMQAYFIYNNLYEFVEIPPGTFTYGSSSITNLHHIISTYQSLSWTNIYCTGSSSLARSSPTSSTNCYGANFNVSNIVATTNSELTMYTPALRLCGNNSQFNQTYWNALEDIRYQYIIQLYRAPKSSGFDGFGYKSQFMHTVQCATSASGTLT